VAKELPYKSLKTIGIVWTDWADIIKLVEHELQNPTLDWTAKVEHLMNSSEAIPLFYRHSVKERNLKP